MEGAKSQLPQGVNAKQAGNNADICWYHECFGEKATKCHGPYQFKHLSTSIAAQTNC